MSDTLYRGDVGRRLRAAIDALGITYTDAAGELGISTSKLGNWMRGENYPAQYTLKQFCDRYGITAEWIYRGIVTGLPSDLANKLWKVEQDIASAPDEPRPSKRPKIQPPAPPASRKERAPPLNPLPGGRVQERRASGSTRPSGNGASRRAGD
jgi:transcriptional regulator with XRE-family HTH domain